MTATKIGIARVRRAVEADVPHIAALYRRVWGAGDNESRRAGEEYFAEVLFENPCYDAALPSLVCEDDWGGVVGCLGVMPRWMAMNGRRVRVAISHNFMVEPSSRSTLAAVKLLRTYFAGPQDLSLAQGNDLSRTLWEGLGGSTVLLYSIRWTRPLRPGRYLLAHPATRGLVGSLGLALGPLCGVVDTLATWLPSSPFRQVSPVLGGEELGPDTMLAGFRAVTGDSALWPEYDERSLPWLLRMLERKKGRGALRGRVVRRGEHETLGWYLYYVDPGRIGEVVQIAAKDGSANEVLDHLFYDAWRHGLVALTGQLQPGFLSVLSDRHCLLRPGGASVLAHSRDPELLHAIHRGQAFLTRLDAEWWINP